MNTMNYRRTAGMTMLCILGWLSASAAAAAGQSYAFEMIIFERPYDSGSEYWPDSPGAPDRALARSPLVSTLPPSARGLGPVAYTLRQRGMTVHEHVIWQEVPGPRNNSNWRWLDAGRVEGLVRVSRGRFLHLHTDLVLRSPGSARTYRARLNRRMRSNELHYVDHPKLGIMIRARRVQAPANPQAEDTATGEPKPAEPSTAPGE